MKIAVIDIGSNSIRYIEAERTAQGFGFSDKTVFTTRLASGLITSGKLAEKQMKNSIDVLETLSRHATANGLPCYCYATSAVRDASNQAAFISDVKEKTGLTIEVLSGDDEAAYARIGAGQTNGGLIDIGGGSSQVITSTYKKSFPLGCIRVRDLCENQNLDVMQNVLSPVFKTVYGTLPPLPPSTWTAVGGTATTLAACSLGMTAYDARQIQQASLTQSELLRLLRNLEALGDDRAKHPLLTKRHDVICGGGLILLYLMERIGIESIRFSDADGLEGFAMHKLQV